MDQVEVYIDDRRLTWFLRYHMGIPDLIEHRLSRHKINLTLRCNLVIRLGPRRCPSSKTLATLDALHLTLDLCAIKGQQAVHRVGVRLGAGNQDIRVSSPACIDMILMS